MITTGALQADHKIAKWIDGIKSRTSQYETKLNLMYLSKKKRTREKKSRVIDWKRRMTIDWTVDGYHIREKTTTSKEKYKDKFEKKNGETMNCATMVPDDRFIYEKDRSTDRRTSRGLASCLRGESEEYYDYEAEGKFIYLHFFTILLHFLLAFLSNWKYHSVLLFFRYRWTYFGIQFSTLGLVLGILLFWKARLVRSDDGALVSR